MFLPCVILGYYLLGRRFRNAFLLCSSLIFYAFGGSGFFLEFLCSIIFNWLFALLIDNANRPNVRRMFFFLCVIGNLALLFVYKYLDFFISCINTLGFDIPLRNIPLPLGISFFTFQAMSYVIDVYRKTVPVQKYLHNIGLYVSFFPQLIAGPIVRYQTIADEIYSRKETFDDFSEGIKRFIIGFSKKIIISNNMALIADASFSSINSNRSVLFAWMGAIAYSFQIFFDFSGYSDMAIGLGRIFGFHFLENFNYPYISASVSEFWRRWHMSLGQWFRDYVYFPLGGSRVKSKARLVFNLFVVWFLTGIWHGASWNFIVWGVMYFVLITFEKLTNYPHRFVHQWKKTIYRIFTLLCILIGWVFFRAETLPEAIQFCADMFGISGNLIFDSMVVRYYNQYKCFLLMAIILSTPLCCHITGYFTKHCPRIACILDYLSIPLYIFLLFWSVSYIMIGSHNPFIYFNF